MVQARPVHRAVRPWAGPRPLWAPRPQPGGRQHTGHPMSSRGVSPNSCGATGQVVVGLTSHLADPRPALGSGSAPSQARVRPLCSILRPTVAPAATPRLGKNRLPGACAGELLSSANAACSDSALSDSGSRTPLALGFGSFSNLLKAMTALTIPQRGRVCRGIECPFKPESPSQRHQKTELKQRFCPASWVPRVP